jgi:hypothetical protein
MYSTIRATGAAVLAMLLLPLRPAERSAWDPQARARLPQLDRLIEGAAGGGRGVHLLDWRGALPADWLDGSAAGSRYYYDEVSEWRGAGSGARVVARVGGLCGPAQLVPCDALLPSPPARSCT